MINITRDHEKPVNLISKQLHELWHRAVVTVDIEKTSTGYCWFETREIIPLSTSCQLI